MTASTPWAGAQFLQLGVLGLRVGAEAVDRDDRRHAETPQVFQMALRLVKPASSAATFSPGAVARDAAVHLQRPHGRDDDRRVGFEPGLAAFDVDEFLGAEIGTEPGLGDDVIGQLQGRASSR